MSFIFISLCAKSSGLLVLVGGSGLLPPPQIIHHPASSHILFWVIPKMKSIFETLTYGQAAGNGREDEEEFWMRRLRCKFRRDLKL